VVLHFLLKDVRYLVQFLQLLNIFSLLLDILQLLSHEYLLASDAMFIMTWAPNRRLDPFLGMVQDKHMVVMILCVLQLGHIDHLSGGSPCGAK
jgi:hypothetical protein